MPDRTYDVTALEFPIVYTLDGDHDRNGLLYTTSSLVPLLRWVRDEWRRDDDWLPEAHRRRQLISMLLDGLARYEEMERLLRTTLVQHADLLVQRGEVVAADATEEEGPDLDVPPARREIEQHYHATVNEIATILDELTSGEIEEVHRAPEIRERWRCQWEAALDILTSSITDRLTAIDEQWDADLPRLVQETGHTRPQLEQLTFNDFIPSHGAKAVAYNRVNPLRPLPAARPLVLRARVGETVEVTVRNEVRDRRVGLHRQGTGLVDGVRATDGAHVVTNPDTTVGRGDTITYRWVTNSEGVWPLNDLADVRGTEDGIQRARSVRRAARGTGTRALGRSCDRGRHHRLRPRLRARRRHPPGRRRGRDRRVSSTSPPTEIAGGHIASSRSSFTTSPRSTALCTSAAASTR